MNAASMPFQRHKLAEVARRRAEGRCPMCNSLEPCPWAGDVTHAAPVLASIYRKAKPPRPFVPTLEAYDARERRRGRP